MTGTEWIKGVLPHRYPMLLVDRVTEVVPGERLVAIKAITLNEPWYRDLPPEADEDAHAYPTVLLVESWCQAAGLLAAAGGEELDGRIPLLGGLTGVEVPGWVHPGDVVEQRVRLVKDLGGNLLFSGESTVAGRTVLLIGSAAVALRPPSALGIPNSQSPGYSASSGR